MILSDQVQPSSQQIQHLLDTFPKDKPVTMINILKYRDVAKNGTESGQEAYARYGLNALPFLKTVGAKLLWRGKVVTTVIGDNEDQAHEVLLVRYPSIAHFINMTSNPDYIKISKDRSIALEYGGLWACEEEYSSI